MSSDNRNQFIDALRAFAVLAMIVYHFAWDLGLFNVVDPVIVNSGRWKLFAVSIGSSFLFLSGISFWLASRNGINFKKFTFRLFFLIVAALIVSLGTYVADSQTFVFFGILHLLSVCTLLGLLIYKLPMIVILIIGFLILFLEPYLISEFYKPKYLAWTGLYTGPTGSVDFYGFFPWSSSYIFGLGISKIIFKRKEHFLFNTSTLKIFSTKGFFSKSFFWLGRNSLIVYLIHQPILIGIIYIYLNYIHVIL